MKKFIISLCLMIVSVFGITSIYTESLENSPNLPRMESVRINGQTNTDNPFRAINNIYVLNINTSTAVINLFNTSEFFYNGVNYSNFSYINDDPNADLLSYQYENVFEYEIDASLGFTFYGAPYLKNVGVIFFYGDLQAFIGSISRSENTYDGYYRYSVNLPPNTPSRTINRINIRFDVGYNQNNIKAITSLSYGNTNQAIYEYAFGQGFQQGQTEAITNPEGFFYSIFAILRLFGDLLYDFFTIPFAGDLTVGFIIILIPLSAFVVEKIVSIIAKLITGS